MNFGKVDKIIFFGGSKPLVEISKYAMAKGINIEVLTGYRLLVEVLGDKTFEELLCENGIGYKSIDNINEYEDLKNHITPNTIGISMGSPWIFSKEVIELLHYKMFNIHPVNIPQMDGGAHFSWQILMNNKVGATVVQLVDIKLNRGSIIYCNEYSFSSYSRIPNDYFKESAINIIETGMMVVDQIVDQKEFIEKPLDIRFRTFYPRLYTDTHGYINWEMRAKDIEKFICAFDDPYNGAMTYNHGKKVRIKDCSLELGLGNFHPFMAGIVFKKNDKALYISCYDGAIVVNKVLDENGNNIIGKIPIGSRFFTPRSDIENAFEYVAFYGAEGIKEEE